MPAGNKPPDRNQRLAEALKQNLKRRKSAGAEKKSAAENPHAQGLGQGLGPGAGTAPQQGLHTSASTRPKTASKRN